jgi:hypothetical protein
MGIRKEISMSFYKKLFGKDEPSGSKKENPMSNNNESRTEVVILNEMREKLLHLNFEETKDGQYPASDFRRGELHVRWTINMKDEVFVFMLREKDREIVRLRSPWYIEINEKAWGEFKEQVLKALDEWLKTI